MNVYPPPVPVDDSQARRDDEHLNLLAVFHFVLAGFAVLGLLFLVLHCLLMRSIFMNTEMWAHSKGGPPPPQIMAMMLWFYGFLALMLVMGGVANLLSGQFIRQRKHRTFSLVVAGCNCIHVPLGTTLGVFTFIVLLRDPVRDLYQRVR